MSPMAQPSPRTPPTQVMGGPPPINTGAPAPPAGYSHSHQTNVVAPPVTGGPPQYGGGQGAPYPTGGSSITDQYRNHNAVEVEGAGKSKSQLIVGIDFVC